MHRTTSQRSAFSWLLAVALLLGGLVVEPVTAAATSATTARAGVADAAAKKGAKKKRPKKKPEKKAQRSKKGDRSAKRARVTDRYVYEHHVVRGDTVGSIAKKYGVSVEDILIWNDLQSPHLIRVDRKLVVYSKKVLPQVQDSYYEVKPGDTLGEIAQRHKMSLRRLKSRNGLRSDLIRPGRQLIVEVPKQPEVLRASRKRGARLDEAVQLTSGAGYHVRDRKEAWGTPSTVRQLKRAFKAMNRKYRGSVIAVGDISKEHGGPLAGHRSHQRGLDVDLSYYRKGQKVHKRLQRESTRTLDADRTWYLIHTFLKGGQVDMMFIDYALQKPLYEAARKAGVRKAELDEIFQYPRGKRVGRGIIRHEPGHDDHIHVRFLDVPTRTSRTDRPGRTSGAAK